MATLAEVDVVIRARLGPLEQSCRQAEARVQQLENSLRNAGGRGGAAFQGVTRDIDRLSNSAARLAGTIGAVLGVKEIIQYSDAWAQAGNKLAAAGEIAGVSTRSLSELNEMAINNRSSFEATVDLYAKLIRTSSGVAKSENEVARATEAVTKAFKAGGATVQEQISGITQLGQALGSGVLQGDELRSIRENAPLVAKAIAEEFKTSVAGLKELGAEGKITSDRVFKAILNYLPQIRAAFDKTIPTIRDSFVILKNRVTEYIGKLSETVGVAQAVSQAMGALSGNITAVGNAALAAGLVLLATFGAGSALAIGAALLNPFVLLAAAVGAAAYAATQFWEVIVPLQGSVATLGDYFKATWEYAKEGADSAAKSIVEVFTTLNTSLGNTLGGIETSLQNTFGSVSSQLNQSINEFVKLYDVVKTVFNNLPAAIADSLISEMNAMIKGVQDGINKLIKMVNDAISAFNNLKGRAGLAAIPTIAERDFSGNMAANPHAGSEDRLKSDLDEIFKRETKDYVGAAAKSIDDGMTKLTERANNIANRRSQAMRRGDDMSSRDQDRYANPTGFGKGGPSKAGGGGTEKEDSLERQIRLIQERTAVITAETAAQAKINPLINDYGYAADFASAKQKLLNAAKKEDLEITPELESKINKLAEAYATATSAADRLAESQKALKAAADDFRNTGKSLMSGFISDLKAGKSASEAFANSLNKLADKFMDMALNALWGTGSAASGGGVLGPLVNSLFGGARAEGGPVSSNKAYLVGEEGPEIMQPGRSGVIIPNRALKPGSGRQSTEMSIHLITDNAAIAGIAQTEIQKSAPAIVRVSVAESQKTTKQNMPGYMSNAQARQM